MRRGFTIFDWRLDTGDIAIVREIGQLDPTTGWDSTKLEG